MPYSAPPIKPNTARLREINQEIHTLLDRLPLSDFRSVTRLNALLQEQEKLCRVHAEILPTADRTLFDNERHRAQQLRIRYREAQASGKLRRAKTD